MASYWHYNVQIAVGFSGICSSNDHGGILYYQNKGIFILKLNNKCNFVLEINANLHVYNDFIFSSSFP